MDRRTFLQRSGLVALTSPVWSFVPGNSQTRAGAFGTPLASSDESQLARIGITTVSLRAQFPSTQGGGGSEPGEYPDLTLETAPAFIAEELGLHNVEVWERHFDDTSMAYCERVRTAAERAGSRIINVQVGVTNPSDPDPEVRARGVAEAREWIDRAVALGSPRIRIDTGGGEGPFDVEATSDSFRQMADYGQEKAVTVLVENHNGYSSDIDNVVAILETVDHPMCRALADYGNTFQDTTEGVIAEISKLFPYLAFVSAKGLTFDDHYQHTAYDFGAIVRATEASGYRGIYSIELYPPRGGEPPEDPVRAANALKETILENLS